MHLETGQVVTCQNIVAIPITANVITAVEKMAEAQGVKSIKLSEGITFASSPLTGLQEWTMTTKSLTKPTMNMMNLLELPKTTIQMKLTTSNQ